MPPLRAMFRVDASLAVASGHVMRCLTLARALAAGGAECRFVCRAGVGNMIDKIRALGFEVAVLSALPQADTANSSGAFQSGTDADDAQDTLDALSGWRPNWIIVDHYGLGQPWETQMRAHGGRLLVIDDYTHRAHDCDVLLNQNLGVLANHYAAGLLPDTCTVLAGTDYAILRPEFAATRPAALQKMQRRETVKTILVSLGGVDVDNATGQVLWALAAAHLPQGWRVNVVMGGQAPHLSSVQAQATAMPFPCQIVVDTTEIARLMVEADLAIGAAGSTSWERCALALPSIILVLAENQLSLAKALVQSGAAMWYNARDLMGLADAVKRLVDDTNLRFDMARRAAKLVDGHGASRVVAVMTDLNTVTLDRARHD
jgi:UDP-2,4-diacetamido-2,4,6-trideoxy-beta-L-altropyranose hydrolase